MPPPSIAPVMSKAPAWKSRVLMSLTIMPHPAAHAASTGPSAPLSASIDAASAISKAAIADGDTVSVSATSASTWPHQRGSQAASANSGCTSPDRGRSQPSSIASGERRWRGLDTFTLSGEKRWNSSTAASSGSSASTAETARIDTTRGIHGTSGSSSAGSNEAPPPSDVWPISKWLASVVIVAARPVKSHTVQVTRARLTPA